MTEALIYDTVRTPRGKGRKGGGLNSMTPISLASHVLKEIRDRNELDTSLVDDVILGCVEPVGEQGADIARVAVLNADYAETTSGVQINRFCASGLEACNMAAAQVMSGQSDFAIGGGVESMSRVPMMSSGGAWASDPAVAFKTYFAPQGVSADLIATLHGFSRDDVDAYAVESQRRAAEAWKEGRFARSVAPVKDINGVTVLDRDEHMRPETTMQSLAALEPSFKIQGENYGFDSVVRQRYPEVERIDHVHHAGNSSGIVDGAAAVLIGSPEAGKAAGLKPRARIRAFTSIGSEPSLLCGGKGAEARGDDALRYRSVGTERGLRLCRSALHGADGNSARSDQRQWRRHRHGPSAGRDGGDDPRHGAGRAGAARSQHGAGDALRRRGHGHGDHHRTGLKRAAERNTIRTGRPPGGR